MEKAKELPTKKKLVEKSGKPFHYEIVEPTKYDRSVGFNIKDDWDFKIDITDWSTDVNAI